MNTYLRILMLLCMSMMGSANPTVHLVKPSDASVNGVRVSRVVPYEVLIYAVDGSGTLQLQDWKIENIPDNRQVYAVNYNGAFVSSSKFNVTLHENGGLKTVHLETTRTLKDAAEAAQAVHEQVLKAQKAEADAKIEEQLRPQKELLEQIKD